MCVMTTMTCVHKSSFSTVPSTGQEIRKIDSFAYNYLNVWPLICSGMLVKWYLIFLRRPIQFWASVILHFVLKCYILQIHWHIIKVGMCQRHHALTLLKMCHIVVKIVILQNTKSFFFFNHWIYSVIHSYLVAKIHNRVENNAKMMGGINET